MLVCVQRERGKRGGRKGGGGTGVCRDQCMVHIDVSSCQQGCREEKASEWWKRERGGRVYDREETGVEWMRQGFCRGKRAFREESDGGEERSGDK